MPELPEVETVVNSLRPHMLGRRFLAIRHLRPDILQPAHIPFIKRVTGRSLADLHRRGKRIIFTLDNGDCFYVHLGMSGQLTLSSPDRKPPPHTHWIVDLAPANGKPMQLRFRDPRRFGGIFWLSSPADSDAGLGPEPLNTTAGQLVDLLAKTRRPIKSALLDQTILAGVGNIYADEALHLAGIHPLAPANLLDFAQIQRLTRAIKQTLRLAIRARGSSLRDYVDAMGSRGAAQRLHRVYHRQGQPCPTCKTLVRQMTLTGRSTHFCPHCQPRAKKRPRANARGR